MIDILQQKARHHQEIINRTLQAALTVIAIGESQ